MNRLILALFILSLTGSPSMAQESNSTSTSGGTDLKTIVANQATNNFTEEFKKSPPKKIRQHIYEIPTMESLTYLHWALSITDINNDDMVDNFIKATECDIFLKFKPDDLEWNKIREITRESIEKNKYDYITRFEIAIPLTLERYNKEKSFFELSADTRIKSARLFEMRARDIDGKICNEDILFFRHYYKSMLLELSRPFSLTFVPTTQDKAEKIIKNSDNLYKDSSKDLKGNAFKEEHVYNYRKAYLFLYVKIFSYKGEYTGVLEANAVGMGQALAVLEGYEIYSDPDRTDLLYSRNYISNRHQDRDEENLKKEIQIIKDKIADKGMLG